MIGTISIEQCGSVCHDFKIFIKYKDDVKKKDMINKQQIVSLGLEDYIKDNIQLGRRIIPRDIKKDIDRRMNILKRYIKSFEVEKN